MTIQDELDTLSDLYAKTSPDEELFLINSGREFKARAYKAWPEILTYIRSIEAENLALRALYSDLSLIASAAEWADVNGMTEKFPVVTGIYEAHIQSLEAAVRSIQEETEVWKERYREGIKKIGSKARSTYDYERGVSDGLKRALAQISEAMDKLKGTTDEG